MTVCANRLAMAALALALVPVGAGARPLAVLAPVCSLIAQPARHRPKRGASRDRALPGKARRRARRNRR